MATLALPSLQIPSLAGGFAPSSQKGGDRPISFLLVDKTTGETSSFSLTIRPEELTRTDVSRMTVQQTLGGAWADDFGPGLASINITGHTGWRGAGGMDGMALFAALKSQVFSDWHTRRNAARAAGLDPAGVQLVFADALDSTTDVVAPVNFVLRRSKSRPLLMQFQISLISLGLPKPADSFIGDFDSALEAIGLGSLADSVDSISSAISSVNKFIQSDLVAPVKAFMSMSVAAFNQVIRVVNAGTSAVSQVLGTAQAIAQCGLNVFHTIAAIANIPANIAAQVMAVAGAYSNVFCVLKNAINTRRIFQNYISLLGASNCSSTAGGSPASSYMISGTNPFYDVVGNASTPPISVTTQSQVGLQRINNTDTVLSPMSTSVLGSTLATVNSGVVVA
ncbi:hypothetical protein [Paraburkholderia sp. MM6662-R1]|uniref:hypothetical protein n=1 Tax=Paraburkholderia sp. MM6662-R1 TaxID=2991066 RepID=UPI003D253CC8